MNTIWNEPFRISVDEVIITSQGALQHIFKNILKVRKKKITTGEENNNSFNSFII